jgi:hypothetical protein
LFRDQSSFLLAWKLIFDSFEDASLRIKSSHIEQIRNSDLVAQTLLPTIFSLLGVGGQASEKRFDIGCWQVDEFVMESQSLCLFLEWSQRQVKSVLTRFSLLYIASVYDPEEPSGLSVLAAYLYYKGLIHVPVRTDRHLVGRITSSRREADLFPSPLFTVAAPILVARVQGSTALNGRCLVSQSISFSLQALPCPY